MAPINAATGPIPSGVTGQDLARVQEYVEDRSGMAFAGVRVRVLAEALVARLTASRHPTPSAYLRHLATPGGDREWQELLEQLRNRDTRFFRDPPALAALTRLALPALRERRSAEGSRRLALWSAGCSTGQEAYSLAMTCLADPDLVGWHLEVLGTDVSAASLAVATAGAYRAHAVADVSDAMRRRFFVPEGDGIGAGLRVAPGVREVVRFAPHDLLTGIPVPVQDVIFCQNVLIYYRPDHRTEILRRLTAALAPGGFLFLGAAEAVGLPTPGLELLRLDDGWVYRRAE